MTDFKYESKDLEAMSSAPRYHTWVLSTFKDFLGKHVAEVGAGSGNFSSLLLKEPIEELVAIEPSNNIYPLLQEKITSDKRATTHNTFFPEVSNLYPNHFDSIVYVDVMEHIKDDTEELSHIYSALKEGGHVCIFVPALQWLYSDHDASIGHYRRYHKKPLENLVEKTGFKIIKVEYFDVIGILSWFVMFKLLKRKPAPGNVGVYDKLVVPISRSLESIMSPPIGKNLIIVGKKVSRTI